MHSLEYTKHCHGVQLDIHLNFHFHETAHSLDLTRILCCAVCSFTKNPFSVVTEQIMNKYVMYKCMELGKHFM